MARILLNLIALLAITISFAQTNSTATDSIEKPAIDSSEVVQKNFQKKLENLERQRLIDSIKKAELEIRIRELKNSDPDQKNQLQAQINALNNQETARLEQKKKEIEALRNSTKGYPGPGLF